MGLNSSFITLMLNLLMRCLPFPGDSDGKESACNVGDPDLIPGLEISPGQGNINPLHYSCLENSMDNTVHGIAKSRT